MMAPEHAASSMPALIDPLEALLEELLRWDEVHLIIKNEAATAELRGRTRLRRGAEWLTIELEESASHAHIRRGAISRAEFLSAPGKSRGVRFLAADHSPAVTCFLPGTAADREGFSASRLETFERLEMAHRRAPWREDS